MITFTFWFCLVFYECLSGQTPSVGGDSYLMPSHYVYWQIPFQRSWWRRTWSSRRGSSISPASLSLLRSAWPPRATADSHPLKWRKPSRDRQRGFWSDSKLIGVSQKHTLLKVNYVLRLWLHLGIPLSTSAPPFSPQAADGTSTKSWRCRRPAGHTADRKQTCICFRRRSFSFLLNKLLSPWRSGGRMVQGDSCSGQSQLSQPAAARDTARPGWVEGRSGSPAPPGQCRR